MHEILKDIYNTILVYDKDVVKNSEVIDEEISSIVEPYKCLLNQNDLDELKGLLSSISLTAEQTGFEIGVKMTLKMLINLLSS